LEKLPEAGFTDPISTLLISPVVLGKTDIELLGIGNV
jgi:hypothetical protein